MKIKSILTGLEQEVTAKEWEAMTLRGDNRKFTIIKSNSEPVPVNDAIGVADYNAIVKGATKLHKDGNLEAALEKYKAAYEIKPTAMLKKKIEEVVELLKED